MLSCDTLDQIHMMTQVVMPTTGNTQAIGILMTATVVPMLTFVILGTFALSLALEATWSSMTLKKRA